MPYQADPGLKEFVQRLPKTETHLHIEGACPHEMLMKIDPLRFSGPFPFWADDFRYRSFYHFMDEFALYAGAVFTSAEQYYDAAQIVLGKCFKQNARYVETSFHIGALLPMTDSGPDVVRAILAGAPDGLEVRVFMGICHDDYHDQGEEIIDDCHSWKDLTGIDLHGPEDLPVEAWTAEVWARAREAGRFNKAHAGEFMGSEFVQMILDDLHVTRIEHGVRAVEDTAVVDRLVRENIGLDICPISNVKLAVRGIPSMRAHPIRHLFDRGVTVSINSDDPFLFGNSLSEEYYALYQELSFSRMELTRIARNGFELALWDETSKQPYLDELDAIADGLNEKD